jgi:hypothetical protein
MPLSKAAFNVQAKITATWLNNLSTGTLLVGVITPAGAVLSGLTPWVSAGPELGYVALGCFMLAFGLHLGARYLLRGIKE